MCILYGTEKIIEAFLGNLRKSYSNALSIHMYICDPD